MDHILRVVTPFGKLSVFLADTNRIWSGQYWLVLTLLCFPNQFSSPTWNDANTRMFVEAPWLPLTYFVKSFKSRRNAITFTAYNSIPFVICSHWIVKMFFLLICQSIRKHFKSINMLIAVTLARQNVISWLHFECVGFSKRFSHAQNLKYQIPHQISTTFRCL